MATDRYLDLLKQGFMRSRKVRAQRAEQATAPIVACVGCRDWHRKGKHVQPADVRRRNERADARARREYEARKAAAFAAPGGE